MVTGDTQDILARLKAALPSRWFGGTSPIVDAVLSGFAAAMASMYSLYQYTILQTRITTAGGIWLDIAAADFYGTGLPRLTNELDDQYRARIKSALFVEQGTRNAIYQTLLRLTGRAPLIFEPARPADTGAYMAAGGTPMGLAYGMAGGYGSLGMAYQSLVRVYLPMAAGIPQVAGYAAGGTSLPALPAGASYPAYNTASKTEYAQLANAQLNVALQAIFNAVDAAKPAGSIVWVGSSL